MDNNVEQIIKAKEPFIIVNAAAAAGKTYCIIERVRFLINRGIDPQKIVVITFTNMAAEEMRTRLGNDAREAFIGTIHSYVNHLLVMGGIQTHKIISEENFDKLFELLIKNPQCARSIQHLLLDEAQDTDPLQWKAIFTVLNPKEYTIVGDTRQAIYGFRGCKPELFANLMKDPNVKIYNLLYNYRNGSEILKFAKQIINKSESGLTDHSFAARGVDGEVIKYDYTPALEVEMINTYRNKFDYGDWFVLTRTNNELAQVTKTLKEMNIPCDTFKRSEITNAELARRMKENTVKVLTIHAAKGLEAKAVMVIGARFWNDEERRVNYVAATRARELLIWTNEVKKKKQKKSTAKMMAW